MPNHIINFPQKNTGVWVSKIEFSRDGLADLVVQVRRLGIRSIVIAPLGYGNGGLDRADVRPLIVTAFALSPSGGGSTVELAGAPRMRP